MYDGQFTEDLGEQYSQSVFAHGKHDHLSQSQLGPQAQQMEVLPHQVVDYSP